MAANDLDPFAAPRVEGVLDRSLATLISGSMRLVFREQENPTWRLRSASLP
jgi:hypothetical protein